MSSAEMSTPVPDRQWVLRELSRARWPASGKTQDPQDGSGPALLPALPPGRDPVNSPASGSFVSKPVGQGRGGGGGKWGKMHLCGGQTPSTRKPEKSQIWGQTNGHRVWRSMGLWESVSPPHNGDVPSCLKANT